MTVTAGRTATAAWVVPRKVVSPAAIAWGATAVAGASAAIGVGIALRWSVATPPHAVLVALAYPTVGGLIVRERPRNPVAWLLVAIGLVNAVTAIANPWAPVALDLAPGALPGGRPVGQVMAWCADGIWILSHGTLVALVPLLFPDGRLPSRRWTPVLLFNLTAVLVQFGAPLSVLPQLGRRSSFDEFYPDERLAERFGSLGYDLVRIGAILAAISLVARLRRMPRDERGPYVWFAAGAIAAVLLLVPISLVANESVYEVIRLASVVTIPVGAAIAILHHRAYGIDLVVNRAIVYGVLTAALSASYVGSVVLVEQLVRASPTFSAVLAAGVTAMVLSPLRRQVQLVVNRAMYGRRDEPHAVAAALVSRLDAVAGGAGILDEVTAEIAAALRLPFVAVEVSTVGGRARQVAGTGVAQSPPERLPLVVQGELVGTLLVGARRGQERLSTRDVAALHEVVPLVGAVVAQIQLGEDLRRARARLANVLEEERRRIRRDLHDGLGPALATVVMGLEEARAVHRQDPERTERLLGSLKEQAREAIDEIRSLVYGLRPPALDELGLRAALAQLVEGTVGRTGSGAIFDAPSVLRPLSAATEVAAYRIVQEALTNVVRHAGATAVVVSVSEVSDGLMIEIEDNGRGLPEPLVAGVGIISMRERAADVGGTVTVESSGGTLVRAVLPDTAR